VQANSSCSHGYGGIGCTREDLAHNERARDLRADAASVASLDVATGSQPRTRRFVQSLPLLVGAATCVIYAAMLVKSRLYPPLDDIDVDLLDVLLLGALLCTSALGVLLCVALRISEGLSARRFWIALALSTAPYIWLLTYWGVRPALFDA